MKNKIYFLCMINYFFAFSQIKNGRIEYAITTTFAEIPKISVIKEEIDEIKNSENLFAFTLNFNKTEASFFVKPSLSKYNQSVEEFCDMVRVSPEIYMSPSKNEFRRFQSYFGNTYLENYKQKSNWKLTTETKVINDIVCFKATTIHYNGQWNDAPHLIVTAWYAPSIPVSFGPNGYHDLPGLILQLQTNTNILFVKKIETNLPVEPLIRLTNKGKEISKAEINKMIFEYSSQSRHERILKTMQEADDRNKRIEEEIKN